MFVSVILDPGGEESAHQLAELLATYGFEKAQRACWESPGISEALLLKLKQDIDRVTDYYDAVRLYQFPVDGLLAITVLSKKKWKRIIVRPPAVPPVSATQPPLRRKP